jgi:flagellum-specific peptidoglycan hydrolase FlgJ
MSARIVSGLLLAVFSMITPVLGAQEYTDNEVKAYLQRYQQLAIEQMRAYSIPASVIMAQAIVESDCGKSKAAIKANNHFGAEAGDDWNGKRYGTDPQNPKGYRWYASVKESFRDNSQFFLERRCAFLFTIPLTNYEHWCRGVRVLKFDVASDYDDRLVSVIKRYRLDTLINVSKLIVPGAVDPDTVVNSGPRNYAPKVKRTEPIRGESYDRISSFVQQIKEYALAEMQEYGMPASVILAQVILESNCGRSPLAIRGNNYFGIRANNHWTGDTIRQMDDCYESGVPVPCSFRKYETVQESFRDHSKFLRKPRYINLFDLEISNYEAWCYGIQVAGYATYPKYARMLIRLIEDHELYEFDLRQ